jgi:hypothetical protein
VLSVLLKLQPGAIEPQPKKISPQIPMSLRLATLNKNARSASAQPFS